MEMMKPKQAKDHVVIFPFMAKGHTIPLIHLAAALSGHGDVSTTFITTPANAPFLRNSLPIDRHPDVHLVVLPFPSCPPLPSGCESTDALPSFDLYPLFLGATSLLRQPFDAVLTHLARSSPPLCLVSDFFLGWTLPICRRLNLPRVVFHGSSAFSMGLCKSLWTHLPALDLGSKAPIHVPGTPSGLRLTRSEIPDAVLKSTEPNDPGTQFLSELGETDLNSWGVLVNSFTDVEGEYAGLFESFCRNGARAWLVGPLSLLASGNKSEENLDDECVRWLDEQETGSVIYVSFGTQAEVPDEQLHEAAHGLAESGHKFLWAVRSLTWAPPDDVRLQANGKIVRWAPQTAVLNHRATGGFVSHCGWNSVMEAVSAGVPMLTWPMIGEQQLNAKLVVEVLGVGLRLGAGGGASGEVVRREEVREGARELMGGGEKGRRARERAAELREKARAAVGDGGSSRRRLGEMMEELRKCQRERERERERNENGEGEGVGAGAMQSEFGKGVQIA